MIIGIGCDIVDHKITSKLDGCNDAHVLNRMFSELEVNQCSKNNPKKYYSGRFAIKEAILKCLGKGMEDGISLKEIELIKSDYGAVVANLKGNAIEIENQLKITNWHISLSHSNDSSLAFVIAESKYRTRELKNRIKGCVATYF